MIGVNVAVEYRRPVNRLDGGDELCDDFRSAAFAEVRDTLNDAFQARLPLNHPCCRHSRLLR